jgi:hypothetical protein
LVGRVNPKNKNIITKIVVSVGPSWVKYAKVTKKILDTVVENGAETQEMNIF